MAGPPAQFRCQAKVCLRLAEKATEYWVAACLTELAEDYLDRADCAEGARAARSSYARSTSTRVSL
jgi:hypothetical protein